MDTFLGLVAFSLLLLWLGCLYLRANEEARKKFFNYAYKTQTDKEVKRNLLYFLLLLPLFILFVLDSPTTELDKCIRANLDREISFHNSRARCNNQGIY